jgi:hypothetical protein
VIVPSAFRNKPPSSRDVQPAVVLTSDDAWLSNVISFISMPHPSANQMQLYRDRTLRYGSCIDVNPIRRCLEEVQEFGRIWDQSSQNSVF